MNQFYIKLATLGSLIMLLISCNNSVPKGFKLVEKVEKNQDELVIPFEKYQLENGLSVVLHEDYSDPMVQVEVQYHVGSAREELGRTGFAHFFEHMMFQGSQNVADEEHIKRITEAGGTLNGYTSTDVTVYHQTLPKNQLEISLWLEADRMGYLLDAVTQEKFEIQRATVKNERGQRLDNRPYGLVLEKTLTSLYPQEHPYYSLPIGFVEDLDRVDVNDLKYFFRRWYNPNNATLYISGDIDKKKTLEWVKKYFQDIPRGPEVERQKPVVTQLNENRYVSYVDNYATLPMVAMAFPTVPSFHEDDAAIKALSYLLATDKISIFYEDFIKSQKMHTADLSWLDYELSGLLLGIFIPLPGMPLSEVEQMVLKSLKRFEEEGVDAEMLAQFKLQKEVELYESMSTVSTKTSMLAQYDHLLGTPNGIQRDLQRFISLTPEKVMEVYRKYIKDKPYQVLSILPKNNPIYKAVAPDNYEPKARKISEAYADNQGFDVSDPTSSFDRSIPPTPEAIPAVTVPSFTKGQLSDQTAYIAAMNDEVPFIELCISIPVGVNIEDRNPQKNGVSDLFVQMMNEGTKQKSAEEFQLALGELGSTIDFSLSRRSITIMVKSLAKNIDPTINLLMERILEPNFSEDDLKRIKAQHFELLKHLSGDPKSISANLFRKMIYQDKDIRAKSRTGTIESVSSITLGDIENYYNDYFSAKDRLVIVVGDFASYAKLEKTLEPLAKWSANPVQMPQLSPPETASNTTIYFMDVPGSAQAEIKIGFPSPLPLDFTGEFYERELMNFSLGEATNSRLNLLLRENKGYTYGAYSYYSGSPSMSQFQAIASVNIASTDSAIFYFMDAIKKYKEEGATEEELAFMKSALGQREALKYESLRSKTNLLYRIIKYNLSDNYTEEQQKVLEAFSAEKALRLLEKHMPVDNMYITVVADKKVVWDKLQKLGYPVVEVNP